MILSSLSSRVLRAFMYGALASIALVVGYTASFFSEVFGAVVSLLINGTIVVTSGLVWAAVELRRKGTDAATALTYRFVEERLEVGFAGRTSVVITPKGISLSGRQESSWIDWGDVSGVEVRSGVDGVRKGLGRAAMRAGFETYLPLSVRIPITIELTLRGNGIVRNLTIGNSTPSQAQSEVEKLRELLVALRDYVDESDRAECLRAWRNRLGASADSTD